jgi:integrase
MNTKPRNAIPTYRFHRRTGRAIITVRNADGSRRDILLPGTFNSAESRQEYERVLTLLRTNEGGLTLNERRSNLTLNELALLFITKHVKQYYVDATTKKSTSEQDCFRAALRPALRLFGDLPAIEFGPLNLRSVRDAMITGSWLTTEEKKKKEDDGRPIGLARTTINRLVNRIRLMFRWATEMQLVPVQVHQSLAAVQGLRRGRSGARETEPVRPVSPALVEDTLPYLPPLVCDMVQLQLLTGMRAGELCRMKVGDIDVSGDVWLYTPTQHKSQWRGLPRTIAIGPRGQAIVRRHLKVNTDAFVFSPMDQEEIIRRDKRAKRQSPVQPSQRDRRIHGAKRKPKDHFTVSGFNRAIRRACEKANIPPWHTHQLRHAAALLIEREYGLDAARATLGHRTANLTAMYSGIDTEKASQVMAKIG